jgi:PAS domain-containing protein
VDETIYSGAMERILGIFPHEIAGQFEIWMLLIHPDDRMAYRREIERVLAEGGPFEAEYRARKKSGLYTILLERGYFIAPAAIHAATPNIAAAALYAITPQEHVTYHNLFVKYDANRDG